MPNPNINTAIAALNAIGIQLPKTVTTEIAAQSKIRDQARTLPGSYTDLAREWVNSTLAGKDPLDSPDLQRAALAYLLSTESLAKVADTVVEQRITDALTGARDAILSEIKTVADAAGAVLTSAHQIIGDRDLSETEVVFRLGAKAVEAHTNAMEAQSTIRKALTAWTSLARITGFASISENVTILADLPQETRQRLRRSGDAWDIVRAGHTIDLAADRATIKARQDRYAEEHRATKAAQQDQWQDQVQRRYGHGVRA